ncbi:hypothetical protein C4D60_Mb07t09310 [Musa balbisiana]|uniref:Phospholipase A1 n=1 Tax=Musa balbisiana TaxID=52838 RepID=A0A4S8JFZ1_MUSBA|nr:hypothetical protein C4D60_Mb07t09310 [Musa balbisiana]
MAQIGGTESPSWADLLGLNHWSGLLDPLDDTLRDLLLMWGDMCQVTADSFISDSNSQYHGRCRYSRNRLLDKTFFPNAADYAVLEYLYALSTFLFVRKESNWMGYVAVSGNAHCNAVGHRDIYIVWRGTNRMMEILEDLTFPLWPFDDDDEDVKVMLGWRDIYNSKDPNFDFNKTSAREQLLETVKGLVERYKDERLSIVCVGHSLGGALAILSAYDIVKHGLSKIGEEYFPVCAITFDSPRVGNQAFRDSWEQQPNLRLLRVKNEGDPVPDYPDQALGYVDFGTVLDVASDQSNFLKDGVILHTVAGWEGASGGFDPTRVKRSLALVNKQGDDLVDKCKIPASWWVEKNKGMVLDKDGDWTKESAREQLLAKIKELVEQYKDESLSIVCLGHSLGGALAILSAYDIVKHGLSKIGEEYFPVCAITFDSPRVGNQAFSDSWAKLPNLRALRVLNKDDLDIPNFPPTSDGYVDIGTVLTVDSRKSPSLKTNHDRHNLKVILHTVAGWEGASGGFDPTRVKRSLALVNKQGDDLVDKCKIPASWWVEKNKGMVLDKDGDWVEAPPGI